MQESIKKFDTSLNKTEAKLFSILIFAPQFYVFVNGKQIHGYSSYVMAPYEKVPPGDRIKNVFTEKPLEEINTHLKLEVDKSI